MAEIHTPAKVVIVAYQCDKCDEGQMIPTGVALMSYPAQYPHKCNRCGHEQIFRQPYPMKQIVPL